MIEKYDPLKGVPEGWYYLEKMFADLETPEIWSITHISDNREELKNACRYQSDLYGRWAIHRITKRGFNHEMSIL